MASSAEGLYRGDCLDWLRSLPDGCATLAIVDGPYGLKLAEWDTFNDWQEYREWYGRLWPDLSRVMAHNACLWVFGTFRSLRHLDADIEASGGWKLRQQVTWDKGLAYVAGNTSYTLRQHPIASECLLYYARESVDISALAWEGVTREDNTVREYLITERDRAGWTNRMILEAWRERYGNNGGMPNHWFVKSQWALPTRENYEWLRSLFNRTGGDYLRREYEDLRREYEDLRREYEDLRYPFNQLGGVTDVWQVPMCRGSERIKLNGQTAHVAQKPVEIMRRVIESTSRQGDLVIDPFAGTGTSAVAAIRLGRRWAGAEITPEYWPIIEARVAEAEAEMSQRLPLEFGNEETP